MVAGTSFLGDPHISIPDNKQNRRNQDIRVPNVRVIDADGEMVGVRSREEALQLAEEAGLDLVEIQPNADPPVCTIMAFGKFRFDQRKKAKGIGSASCRERESQTVSIPVAAASLKKKKH